MGYLGTISLSETSDEKKETKQFFFLFSIIPNARPEKWLFTYSRGQEQTLYVGGVHLQTEIIITG